MTAYVKYRRGGYQRVSEFDAFSYEDQLIYVSYYRDTGWVPNIYGPYAVTTAGPNGTAPVLLNALMSPATGTDRTPDEMAHTPPRNLSWQETKLKFTLSGRVVAEFYWKDIVSWSTNAPVVT